MRASIADVRARVSLIAVLLTGATLLAHLDRVLASPRREHPPVAFDFWDQVDRAEEFDEIKQYRPAAFQALPAEPLSTQGSRDR